MMPKLIEDVGTALAQRCRTAYIVRCDVGQTHLTATTGHLYIATKPSFDDLWHGRERNQVWLNHARGDEPATCAKARENAAALA